MTAPYKGPYRMEHITWHDHWSMGNGWVRTEDVELGSLPIHSVGYVVKENKDGVLLAGQVNTSNTDTVGGLMFIIKKCIIKRKKLK